MVVIELYTYWELKPKYSCSRLVKFVQSGKVLNEVRLFCLLFKFFFLLKF